MSKKINLKQKWKKFRNKHPKFDKFLSKIKSFFSRKKAVEKDGFLYQSSEQLVRSEEKENYGLPFVVFIQNKTTDDLEEVKILDREFKDQDKVKYEYHSGDVTYHDFLRLLDSSDGFKIGKVQLLSTNTNQPFQVLHFSSSDINGTSVTWPITPILDPNQNQAGVAVIKYKWTLDANSQIKTTLLASAGLKLIIFPIEKTDNPVETHIKKGWLSKIKIKKQK